MKGRIVNLDQAAVWNGDDGDHWATHADHYDRMVARHHDRLLTAAAVCRDDHVLDIGCGNGQTTREAARRAFGGEALGIDLSAPMLARARQIAAAEGLRNVTFVHADAQTHPLQPGHHDLALSRFGAMFFSDPVTAFSNIARGLRLEGRLVLLAWQGLESNPWQRNLRGALAAGRTLREPPTPAPGPFGLADPAQVRSMLTEAGFTGIGFEDVREPVWFGVDRSDALAHLLGMGLVTSLLAGLDEERRAETEQRLAATLADAETADGVVMGSAAWLITARRH